MAIDTAGAKFSVEKNGQVGKKTVVYIRSLNGTKELGDGARQVRHFSLAADGGPKNEPGSS